MEWVVELVGVTPIVFVFGISLNNRRKALRCVVAYVV
jgi:hypothetical protein